MSKQRVLVIGASRGIGKELVRYFSKQGLEVLACARSVDKLEKLAELPNVHVFELDLASPRLREELSARLSGLEHIDFMVNNAGTLVNKPFLELSHSDIQYSYQVNVIGVMQAVQAVLPKMSDFGHVVNISSMGGFQGSVKFPGLSAYSTSKAAVVSFTELFAEEHKESPVRMNCLCLGAVQTEMLEEAFPGYQAPLSAEEMAKYIGEFTLNAWRYFNGKILPVSLSTP